MSSFLWLLLYLAPLLGLTAAAFAWLGWHWRSTDLRKEVQELKARIDEMQNARSAGEVEHDTLRDKARASEAELRVLRDELKSTQELMRDHQDDTAKAQEFSHTLKSELARTIHDLEAARAERDQNAAALAGAHAEIERLRSVAQSAPVEAVIPAAPIPPSDSPAAAPGGGTKRTRHATSTAPSKARTTAARHASLQDTLAVVETQLATHEATVTALMQERDDWQRRVTKLEAQPIADPAGLGLAYRSLADSESRLQSANSEIDRLQNQFRVLRKMGENAEALAGVADDDLTRIKGIKNVISEQLRAHGIRTWRQIASWDDNELRAFSELLAFKNRATREKWKEQARALHESAHGQLF